MKIFAHWLYGGGEAIAHALVVEAAAFAGVAETGTFSADQVARFSRDPVGKDTMRILPARCAVSIPSAQVCSTWNNEGTQSKSWLGGLRSGIGGRPRRRYERGVRPLVRHLGAPLWANESAMPLRTYS
jgi:hypothetical protein